MAQWEYPHRYRLDNYTFVMPFERAFDSVHSTMWMQRNWWHSITLSVAYVVAIYVGQRMMAHRKPFDLERVLTLWNTALAIFSIIGVCRMTPEFIWSISGNSWRYSMCTASFAQGVTGFWTEMFALSKVVEFGDTAFIVLRKRPVIFLHWYHHVTVLMYTWHAYKDHTASGRWFIWMNYSVHAIMYSYYALRSFNIRLPKRVAMFVTSAQMLQMIVGIVIAINAYRIKLGGGHCQQTFDNLHFSFTIYFTYFLLFCNFFYNAYLKSGNRYASNVKKVDENGTTAHVGSNGTSVTNGHVKKRANIKAE